MRTKAFRTTIVAILTATTIAGGMAVGTETVEVPVSRPTGPGTDTGRGRYAEPARRRP